MRLKCRSAEADGSHTLAILHTKELPLSRWPIICFAAALFASANTGLIFASILHWLFAAAFYACGGHRRQSISLASAGGHRPQSISLASAGAPCRRWSLYAYAALSLFFLFFRSTAPVAPDAAVIIQSRSRLASPVFSGEDELPVFPSSCVTVFGELFPPPPD